MRGVSGEFHCGLAITLPPFIINRIVCLTDIAVALGDDHASQYSGLHPTHQLLCY